MINAKLWLKNRLEKLILSPPFLTHDVLKRSALSADDRELQIIIPHRVNWRLTTSTIRAFDRLTTGKFGITLVVNFDPIPDNWEGFQNPRLTVVRNRFTTLGRLFSRIFSSENGSISNALGIELGLLEDPGFHWALVAHSDSAPLRRGWNEEFRQALGTGMLIGNTRDTSRVFAAHAAGTMFNAREYLKRGGCSWPTFRFGEMVQDVGDGITLALHPPGQGLAPVLPNTRQEPELIAALAARFPVLYGFAENGTQVSFAADRQTPIFAHMGRGTPRSKADPTMAHKLPVDSWIDWIDTLN
jgi:hypothetical protein